MSTEHAYGAVLLGYLGGNTGCMTVDRNTVCRNVAGISFLASLGLRDRPLGALCSSAWHTPDVWHASRSVVLAALEQDVAGKAVFRHGARHIEVYAQRVLGCADVLWRDVSDLVERDRALLYDELTGLYNRRGFFTVVEQQLKVLERRSASGLMFFLDVNGLKRVNDVHGHEAGDQLILDTAALIRESFRDADMSGRLGGDEFVVFVPEVSPSWAEVFYERVRAWVLRYNRARPCVPLSVSIGAAVYTPTAGEGVRELIKRADAAMYRAKASKLLAVAV